VKILQSDFQFVHLKVGWRKQAHWYLTVVYGSPKFQYLKVLWEALINIAGSIRGGWSVIGGFNTIHQPHDRSGGTAKPSWRGA